MSTRHIVLSHPVRTAIGRYNGTLKSVHAIVRLAFGDLFLGPYPALIAALTSKRPAAQLGNA